MVTIQTAYKRQYAQLRDSAKVYIHTHTQSCSPGRPQAIQLSLSLNYFLIMSPLPECWDYEHIYQHSQL